MKFSNLSHQAFRTESTSNYGETKVESVLITVTPKSASVSCGITMRVSLENVSSIPQVLTVCPTLSLCNVKGIHVSLDYEDKWITLLNIWREPKPMLKEVFLLPGSAFSCDLRIPSDYLHDHLKQAGKDVSVEVLYALGEDRTAYSNKIRIRMGR